MNIWIYGAGMYCETCTLKIKADLDPELAEDGDFETYPSGPHPDGGGESCVPLACDDCGRYLENPLDADGLEMVRTAIADDTLSPQVLSMWAHIYGHDLSLP